MRKTEVRDDVAGGQIGYRTGASNEGLLCIIHF